MKKVLLSFLLAASLSAAPVPYSKIEPVLEETWDRSYPVRYSKIIKKDLLGKGIMVLRNKSGSEEYLYSFKVFFPRYSFTDSKLVAETEGREIIVRLYHNPSDKENPYRIDLGEFTEKYELGKALRWIK